MSPSLLLLPPPDTASLDSEESLELLCRGSACLEDVLALPGVKLVEDPVNVEVVDVEVLLLEDVVEITLDDFKMADIFLFSPLICSCCCQTS